MYLNYHSVRYVILGITLKLSNSSCLANFVSELNCYFVTRVTFINEQYQMFLRKLRKPCFPKELRTIVDFLQESNR